MAYFQLIYVKKMIVIRYCKVILWFCLTIDPVLRHGIDAALGQRLVFALIVFKIVHLHVYPADTRR